MAALPAPGEPGAVEDARYCGEPSRTPAGRIKRSRAALDDFVKVFPCPANLKHTTSCPGWNIDHTIPLASGGCDTPVNMSWLPVAIKACNKNVCKDRFERACYAP